MVLFIKFGYFFGLLTASYIDNATALAAPGNIQQFPQLVFFLLNHVADISPFKTLLKNVRFLEKQFLLNVLPHLCRCSCGKCQYGNTRVQFAQVGDMEVWRSEIITPLRYTMRLVNSDQADIHILDTFAYQIRQQAFRREIL